MHLVTFTRGSETTLGAVIDDGRRVVDLSEAGVASSMIELIKGGQKSLKAAAEVCDARAGIPIDELQIEAPIPRPPRNIICVGLNYAQHSAEFKQSGFDSSGPGPEIPQAPVIFTKAPSTVSAPGAAIPASRDPSASVDYEGELAIVVGRGGRGITRADAFDHIFGYTIVNDVTARDLQQKHKQWFLGKSIDGFCPMGPFLITSDEIEDVRKLRVTTKVNDELRQDASVQDLIFDIPCLIETISELVTLEPGDIIATGTPKGVGIGFKPPKYLKPGDEVVIEIVGIGRLKNSVS